jgi:hypothetical protein
MEKDLDSLKFGQSSDDMHAVSDDTADDTLKTPSDRKPALDKLSGDSDDSDDKKRSFSKSGYIRVAI